MIQFTVNDNICLWLNAGEANLFEEALQKYGKDFTDIQKDFVSSQLKNPSYLNELAQNKCLYQQLYMLLLPYFRAVSYFKKLLKGL